MMTKIRQEHNGRYFFLTHYKAILHCSQNLFFMKLFLSSESTPRDINKEFQRLFPCLKMEFYRHKHQVGATSLFDCKISSRELLKDISDRVPGFINIDPMDTVAEVEQRFQIKFGLSVQIFRRAGEVWLETVETDNLCLQKQNRMGFITPKMSFNVHTLFL
jgi:hypothetical protein